MKKKDIIQEIKKLYKYAKRSPYSTAERTQQSIRLFWKLEDLVEKIDNKGQEK